MSENRENSFAVLSNNLFGIIGIPNKTLIFIVVTAVSDAFGAVIFPFIISNYILPEFYINIIAFHATLNIPFPRIDQSDYIFFLFW